MFSCKRDLNDPINEYQILRSQERNFEFYLLPSPCSIFLFLIPPILINMLQLVKEIRRKSRLQEFVPNLLVLNELSFNRYLL